MKKEELTEMIGLYGDEIYAFCYRLTNNKNDADELYQDTFLKAVEIYHRIDCQHNPRCYLIGIANRLWKNQHKKHENRNRLIPMQHITDEMNEKVMNNSNVHTPESILLQNECDHIILESLNLLDDKFRIPLIMYYSVELPLKEIAKILKVPEGTIKTRLYKGRKIIKKELEEKMYAK